MSTASWRRTRLASRYLACDAFQLAVLRWQPFADSIEALKRLRTKFRLVAMTMRIASRYRATAHAWATVRRYRLRRRYRRRQTNPNSCLQQSRQSAFGYKQSDILHVAQSQYHDIGIARKLGYKVCWIERRQAWRDSAERPTYRR